MKIRIKYLIMIIACFVMCAVIVLVNYKDYKNSKLLVEEDAYAYDKALYTYSRKISSGSDKTETININTATAKELADFLPSIGETKAENIVAYREAIGGFKSVEELIEVSGIGEATLDIIRDYCRVSDD